MDMSLGFEDILLKQDLDREDIKVLLSARGPQQERLLKRGLEVKLSNLNK